MARAQNVDNGQMSNKSRDMRHGGLETGNLFERGVIYIKDLPAPVSLSGEPDN